MENAQALEAAMDALTQRFNALQAEREQLEKRAKRAERDRYALEAELDALSEELATVRARSKILILELLRRLVRVN